MISSSHHRSLEQARVWIFSAICFALPMRASFIYVFSALLLLIWVVEGHWREKISEIFRSRLCLAFLVYYSVFILAMLWTENTAEGWQMVDRQTPVLLFLLFWSSADPRYRERYISAFLAGLCVCAILAHYNWLQLYWFPDWPRGVRVKKSPTDTAPFVDWIMYAPILALGIYFALRRAVFSMSLRDRVPAMLIACLLVSNLSFSGGRAGMVMFAILGIALVFEKIKARVKALLVSVILLPLIFCAGYGMQEHFANRVDQAVSDIRTFEQNPNTSLGWRIIYWTTTFKIIGEHPLLGVGSGDFQEEYVSAKTARWKESPDTFNPHNQFLMTWVTTGLLGLASLLFIFYYSARSGYDMRMYSVLIGFAVIFLFESYLWRSNTALTFSIIIAALANKEKADIARSKPGSPYI